MMKFRELTTGRKVTYLVGETMFLGALFLRIFSHSLPTAPLVGVMIAGLGIEILTSMKATQRDNA